MRKIFCEIVVIFGRPSAEWFPKLRIFPVSQPITAKTCGDGFAAEYKHCRQAYPVERPPSAWLRRRRKPKGQRHDRFQRLLWAAGGACSMSGQLLSLRLLFGRNRVARPEGTRGRDDGRTHGGSRAISSSPFHRRSSRSRSFSVAAVGRARSRRHPDRRGASFLKALGQVCRLHSNLFHYSGQSLALPLRFTRPRSNVSKAPDNILYNKP